MGEVLSAPGLEAFDACAARHVDGGDVPGVAALTSLGDQVLVTTLGVLTLGGAPRSREERRVRRQR